MTIRLRLLGVALVSLATPALEPTLTRLFSPTMFSHVAFWAISLSFFGSGASGVSPTARGLTTVASLAWMHGAAPVLGSLRAVAIGSVLRASAVAGGAGGAGMAVLP